MPSALKAAAVWVKVACSLVGGSNISNKSASSLCYTDKTGTGRTT